MKFRAKNPKLAVYVPKSRHVIRFKEGVYEADDKDEIEALRAREDVKQERKRKEEDEKHDEKDEE